MTPRRRVLLIFGLPVLLGVPLALLAIGLRKGGFLDTSNVGALAELAPYQEKLRPLDACRIRYALRDKRGHRSLTESVFVETCTGTNEVVVVKVPHHRDVGFEMKRRSASEPFDVLVEKKEVPFPSLLATFEDFTPRILANFEKTLSENRARDGAYRRQLDERRRADETRKATAKESYPSP